MPLFPRYYKAAQSHGFYTNDWHCYIFLKKPSFSKGYQSGITIKHRIKKGKPELWKHFTFRKLVYLPRENSKGYERATITHIEFTTHLSEEFKGKRIPKSKRYIRLKICK